MSEHNDQAVVDLVDAGVPADQGLSSLGLLMQLAGNVLAAYAAMITFATIFLSGGNTSNTLWIFLLLGTSIARSMLHRTAGSQLLYGTPSLEGESSRMRGIQRYVGFALIQTAVFAAILYGKFHVEGTVTVGIAAGLAAWPVTLLALLALPRFRRFRNDLPLTEDKGFEGASILMTVLGLCGVVGTGTVLLVLLELPDAKIQQGPAVLVLLALAMLVVRSVLHVQAGASGLRETSLDRSVELANRYANFGIISSFCGAGALLLFVMASPALGVLGLAVVSALCWMLIAWPMIIRRFFSDRQFADLLAGGEAPLHRRAPDAGLTALGWLLVGHGVFCLSFVLPELIAGTGGHDRTLQSMFAVGGALGARSVWWGVGVIVLQLWAGFELVRMSPHSRIVASVFGVVGAAVTIYINLPIAHALGHIHGMVGPREVMMLGPMALSLIIPVATVLLVNRKIAPMARARFRPRTPAGGDSPSGASPDEREPTPE